MSSSFELTLSVVSHGQRALILELFEDIRTWVRVPCRVILTENLAENTPFDTSIYPFPVELIQNSNIKGFGANHNAALRRVNDGFFCVLNPDIRLTQDPFPTLIACLKDPRVAIVAPKVTDPEGAPEDHARKFPSVFSLIAKFLGKVPSTRPNDGESIFYPDWVAGMFMLSRIETLQALGGFDERYFLYYEDVDLCARARDQGLLVAATTETNVIHAARRASRRDARHAMLHIKSGLRYLSSYPSYALGMGYRVPSQK